MNADRAHSMLTGMACGDALGATVEFQSPASIESVHGELREMIGGGWLHLEPGQTTDDTQMAVCLSRSLADAGGYATRAAVSRYLAWMRSGPPDVGTTISSVLRRVDQGMSPAAATDAHHRSSGGMSAGNGSLMRCWPLVAAYDGKERDRALEFDSRSTHHDPLAADACVFAGRLAAGLAEDRPFDQIALDASRDLHAEVYLASQTDPEQARSSSMQAMGFVLTALGVACASLRIEDPEEALVWAVGCGGDADTNGAIAGALLGARGAQWPRRWTEVLDVREWLDEVPGWLVDTRFAAPVDERHEALGPDKAFGPLGY